MTSQRMTSVSCDPEASWLPLLLYRSAVTALLCPVRVTCGAGMHHYQHFGYTKVLILHCDFGPRIVVQAISEDR